MFIYITEILLNFDEIDQIIFCVIILHGETSFALSVAVEGSWQNFAFGFIQQFSGNRIYCWFHQVLMKLTLLFYQGSWALPHNSSARTVVQWLPKIK